MATKMTQSEIEVDGNIIINGKAYPAIELLKAINRSVALSFDNETAQLILNDMPIQPIYGSTRKNVFSLLCYHSLAYCCPRTHKCDKRDATLKMLNISLDEYSRIKDEHHSLFLEFEHTHSHTTYSENSPSRVDSQAMSLKTSLMPGSITRNFSMPARTASSISISLSFSFA